MDARRSRLPEKPVNIGDTAQKARKQGDGPPARGTRSPNKGIGTWRQPKASPCRRQLLPTRALRLSGNQKSMSAAGRTLGIGLEIQLVLRQYAYGSAFFLRPFLTGFRASRSACIFASSASEELSPLISSGLAARQSAVSSPRKALASID